MKSVSLLKVHTSQYLKQLCNIHVSINSQINQHFSIKMQSLCINSVIAIVFVAVVAHHTTVAPPVNSITFVRTTNLSNTESLNNLKRKVSTRKKNLVDQLLQVAIQALQNTLTSTARPPETTTCSNSVVVVNMAPVGSESFEPAPAPHPGNATTPGNITTTGTGATNITIVGANTTAAGATTGTAPPTTAVMTGPGSQPIANAPVPPPTVTNVIIGPSPAVMNGPSGGPSGVSMASQPATSVMAPSAIYVGGPGQAPSVASSAILSGVYPPTPTVTKPPAFTLPPPPPPTQIILSPPSGGTFVVPSTSATSSATSNPSTITVGSTVITAPAPSTVTVGGSPSSIIINKDPNSMIPMAVMVPRDPQPPSYPFGAAQREPLMPPRPSAYSQAYNFAHG
ncbi:unnamed protein product [Allacma fusca]|uniref:Uncharacterized protein n=1 Tax=Allacma fusca TaxID=39272 RepID=A0A8J2J5V0_9HEXA|nr:unnamed protein product [Allacma fusca]